MGLIVGRDSYYDPPSCRERPFHPLGLTELADAHPELTLRIEPGRALTAYANLVMGANLMEAARLTKVGKVVNIGTACSYPGYLEGELREDDLATYGRLAELAKQREDWDTMLAAAQQTLAETRCGGRPRTGRPRTSSSPVCRASASPSRTTRTTYRLPLRMPLPETITMSEE